MKLLDKLTLGDINSEHQNNMKKYKKFELKGKKNELINILESVKSIFHQNFVFDKPRSDDYAIHTANPKNCTATFLSHTIGNPIAFVWLVIMDEKLYISNITPKIPGQLTFDEYNNILDNF